MFYYLLLFIIIYFAIHYLRDSHKRWCGWKNGCTVGVLTFESSSISSNTRNVPPFSDTPRLLSLWGILDGLCSHFPFSCASLLPNQPAANTSQTEQKSLSWKLSACANQELLVLESTAYAPTHYPNNPAAHERSFRLGVVLYFASLPIFQWFRLPLLDAISCKVGGPPCRNLYQSCF